MKSGGAIEDWQQPGFELPPGEPGVPLPSPCAILAPLWEFYVRLAVNPNRIEAKQWEAFYRESLLLLTRFPAPLMRLKAQESPSRAYVGATRSLATPHKRQSKNDSSHCIAVSRQASHRDWPPTFG